MIRSSRDVARDAHRDVLTIPARTLDRRTGRIRSPGVNVHILRNFRGTWTILLPRVPLSARNMIRFSSEASWGTSSELSSGTLAKLVCKVARHLLFV